MKLIKLTVLTSLLFSSLIMFTSCEPDAELKKLSDFQKNGIVLSSAQEVPANPSTALGTMNVFYTKDTRILSYTVTWQGLTGYVTAMYIHGLAPAGYAASGETQKIVDNSSNGIFRTFIQPANVVPAFGATGKLSGTLLVDGVTVKEQDLLNGNYYLNIYTVAYPYAVANPLFRGGEIRGQIRFQ